MANQYDVHIQLVPQASFTGSKFYSFGYDRTLGVRGLQKLINMWAKYFLTPVGSDPTDLSVGTDFMGLLGSNVDVNDAQDILLIAVDKTNQAIQSYQTGRDIADDERLANAEVTDYIVLSDANGFAAQIHITNVAGEGLSFLLPTLQTRT